MNAVKKPITWLYLTLLGAVGLFLRILNLIAIALWHDESFSVLMVKYSFSEMLYRLTLDVHPPFYYVFFFVWDKIFGNSLFSLRFFSVIFGMLAAFTGWWIVKKIFREKKLALWALAVLMVNPFLILYSQEGRMYALGLFLTMAGAASLLAAVKRKKVICWGAFILFSLLAVYTHYYLLFSVFAFFLFILFLVWKKKKEKEDPEERKYLIKSALISAGVVFLLYTPWLPYFFKQLKQVQENYWIPEMSAWSVPNTLINLLTGGIWPIGESNWWWGVILIGLILFFLYRGFKYLKERSSEGAWLILLSFITPFILAILLSFKQSLYLDRYFIFIVPFYLILLSAGIYSLKKAWLRKALLIIFIILMAYSCFTFWQKTDPADKPGMRGASKYLNIKHEKNEKILSTSSFVYFTFRYYNETSRRAYLYAPGKLTHFSGTALLSKEDTVKSFKDFAGQGDEVWIISTSGFGGYRPTPPGNWKKLSEAEFPDSNGVKGSIFIEEYLVK